MEPQYFKAYRSFHLNPFRPSLAVIPMAKQQLLHPTISRVESPNLFLPNSIVQQTTVSTVNWSQRQSHAILCRSVYPKH